MQHPWYIYWRFLLQTFEKRTLAKARKLIEISRVRVCSVAMEPSSKRSKLEMWTPSLSSEEATPGLVTLGVWFGVFFRQALKKLKGGILVVAFLLKVFCWWSIHIYSFLEIWRNLKKYIYICVLNFTQTCDMVWRNPSDDFFRRCCILGDAFLDITCKDFSGCNIITQLAEYTAYIRYILSSRGLYNPQLPITRTRIIHWSHDGFPTKWLRDWIDEFSQNCLTRSWN